MPKLIRIENKHRAALSEVSGNAAGVAVLMQPKTSSNSKKNSFIPSSPPSTTQQAWSQGPVVLQRYPSAASTSSSSTSTTSSSTVGSKSTGSNNKRQSLEVTSSKQVKRWDERFDELVKFKVLYGSCRVPHRYPDNPGLSRWVVYMRSSYQAGTLPSDRIEKLNQVGFIWSDRGHTTWDKRLQQLEQYKALHGTSRVSCDTPESAQLWRWSSVQRANYRLGKLSSERIKALDDLGFIWDVDQHDWDCKFDDLADFYRTFGHTRLPNKEPYKKLFLWARVQRTKFHDNSLSAERVAKLQLLDFGWEKNTMYTTSAGHVAMDANFPDEPGMGDGRTSTTSPIQYTSQADEGSAPPPPPTVSSVTSTHLTVPSITMVPKVSILKTPPRSTFSAKKDLGGFDRLLQLAELARTFSPVPLSPVRPFRP